MDNSRLSQLKKPVAIAMWDYSWLLRHHFGNETFSHRQVEE